MAVFTEIQQIKLTLNYIAAYTFRYSLLPLRHCAALNFFFFLAVIYFFFALFPNRASLSFVRATILASSRQHLLYFCFATSLLLPNQYLCFKFALTLIKRRSANFACRFRFIFSALLSLKHKVIRALVKFFKHLNKHFLVIYFKCCQFQSKPLNVA